MNQRNWAREAAEIHDLYLTDFQNAYARERLLLRDFVLALSENDATAKQDAMAIVRELLQYDTGLLATSGTRYIPPPPKPPEPLREIQIAGGPRDGELVAYHGQALELDGHRYCLFRGRDREERTYHRYVYSGR